MNGNFDDGIGIHVSGGEINGNVSTLLKLETPSESSLYDSLVSISAPNYKRGTVMKIDAPGLENGAALDVRGGSQLENGALVRLEVTGNNPGAAIKIDAPDMAEGTALKIVSNSRIFDAATNISMTGTHSGVIHLSAPKLKNGGYRDHVKDML